MTGADDEKKPIRLEDLSEEEVLKKQQEAYEALEALSEAGMIEDFKVVDVQTTYKYPDDLNAIHDALHPDPRERDVKLLITNIEKAEPNLKPVEEFMEKEFERIEHLRELKKDLEEEPADPCDGCTQACGGCVHEKLCPICGFVHGGREKCIEPTPADSRVLFQGKDFKCYSVDDECKNCPNLDHFPDCEDDLVICPRQTPLKPAAPDDLLKPIPQEDHIRLLWEAEVEHGDDIEQLKAELAEVKAELSRIKDVAASTLVLTGIALFVFFVWIVIATLL